MTRSLPRRTKKNELTPAARLCLSCGVDFFGELRHMIDVTAIEAELRELFKRGFWENEAAIRRLEHILSGHLWGLPDDDPRIAFLRGEWKRHADEITCDHIKRFPGSRPFGFWYFDHPDECPPGAGSHTPEGKAAELKYLVSHGLLSRDEEIAIHWEDDVGKRVLECAGATADEKAR